MFYLVYGAQVETISISSGKYRYDGIPDGIKMMAYGPDMHPEVVDSFRTGYLWNELRITDPSLASTVAAQTRCMILRGTTADKPTLNYFRNTIGLLTYLLDNGGVSIFDPQSFKWWSRSEWMSKVFDPGAPQPREHVVILVSDEDDGTQWYHTRGLRKFGRPDLSLRSVPLLYRDAVADLFDRFIQYQVFGGVIDEGQEIRMRSLPAGMYCTPGGNEDDPDFNNFHVEIKWP